MAICCGEGATDAGSVGRDPDPHRFVGGVGVEGPAADAEAIVGPFELGQVADGGVGDGDALAGDRVPPVALVVPPVETHLVFAVAHPAAQQRIAEADEFYAAVQRPDLSDDERQVQRQALAGLMWSKQFYHYSVELWLEGDPAQPPGLR